MEAPERSFAAMEGGRVHRPDMTSEVWGGGGSSADYTWNTILAIPGCPASRFLLFSRTLLCLGSVIALYEIIFCLHGSGKASVVCSQEFQLAQASLKSAIPIFPLQITLSHCKSYQLKKHKQENTVTPSPIEKLCKKIFETFSGTLSQTFFLGT